ncbi:MAG: GNAT family N-acetyltransferase [Actinomycetota bacterium]|nr:GNAT family N-acetyltransferase [Actinomycetota bacterium]
MPSYAIHPTADLRPIAALYEEVGFRPDLVDDLGFLRELGGTVFVATSGWDVVGAGSCLPFERTGWVGGVAVHPGHRGAGLGSDLTEAAMRALEQEGVRTALLHATAVAKALYERLGFVAETEFAELRGGGALAPPREAPRIRAAEPDDLEAVLALDRESTGEDRRRLIGALWPHGALVAEHESRPIGFALPQRRSSAGAVVAADPVAGQALLAAAIEERGEPVRVGVPTGHADALALLEGAGYSEALRTTRMHRGEAPGWSPERIFATFNLYWG